MIPGSASPHLLGAPAGATGYQISRSLRFNSADSAYLSRTPSVAGNRKTWTWAGWVKRSALTTLGTLFGAWNNGGADLDYFRFVFNGGTLQASGGSLVYFNTTNVFRDPSAWYHIVLVLNTPSAVANERFRLYVNGLEVITFATRNNPTQNADFVVNSASAHNIGRSPDNAGYFDGCLADVHLVDGQALDPTSFGQFDATTGVWVPKAYTGTYGTNGFRLDFSDNSAATAAALGADRSGNSNNWTPNNLSVTAGAGNDSLVDVPVNGSQADTGVGGEVRGNYCTWSPIYAGASGLSNGNLDATLVSGLSAFGSISVTTGKWFWEITITAAPTDSYLGIIDSTFTTANNSGWSTQVRAYRAGTGNKYDGTSTAYGASWTVNNVIGVALDLDNGTLVFYRNGVSQGTAFNTGLIGKEWRPLVYNATSYSANFGQRPFAYTAPSGFKALCTANLPAPTIVKPNTAMDVVTYTGNGSTQTISGLGFSPDLVWIKDRNAGNYHNLLDTIRGTSLRLSSNVADAENDGSAGGATPLFSSFNSDGWSMGNGNVNVNGNTTTYVAWCWDAGSSNATNTSGTISSTVRANASAGFGVVTYTGNNTAGATVGHGLGVAPALIIVKRRAVGDDWMVYHSERGATRHLVLNSTAAEVTSSNRWNSTAPTSTVFSVGAHNSVNGASSTYVAYCFAQVAGYSAFGNYTGNGVAEGPFVYLGFRPALVIVKMSSSSGNWTILDYKREGYNVDNDPLYPNLGNVEATTDLIDITSNGFKVRTTDASFNTNAGTYVYAAWAESPFQYSRAR